MTHVGPAPVTASAGTAPTEAVTGFVEWSSVFAGAVLAAALSFVLLTFGTAIGLSATSPWPSSGLSVKWLASLAVFWALTQQIGAFMAGGYVAGRMRSRWRGTADHETEFRDGLHGGLVWAVGVVIGAALLMAAAGATSRIGAEVAGKAAVSVTSTADPMDLVLDTMLRPGTPGAAATPAPGTQPPAALGARVRAGMATGGESRSEMSRIIASAVANGSLSDQNRVYLVQLVAQRTGLSQPEAEKRVNEAFTAARQAADKARHGAVLTAFVTAAGLVLSFGAAWWAAIKGGQHRDNSVPARFDFAAYRRPGGRP